MLNKPLSESESESEPDADWYTGLKHLLEIDFRIILVWIKLGCFAHNPVCSLNKLSLQQI